MSADWPNQKIDDVGGEAARLFALALRDAIGDMTLREVGQRCGLNATTIMRILNGTRWPDIRTAALLETGLGVDLWPTRARLGRSV